MTEWKLRRVERLMDRIGIEPSRGLLRRFRSWRLERICRKAGVDIADDLFLPQWAIDHNARVSAWLQNGLGG